jgi:hypothetical protein
MIPHRRLATLPTLLIAGAAATATGACVWDHLDAIGALPSTGVDAAIDAMPPVDGTSTAPDAPSSSPCMPQTTPIDEWTFDSEVQPWTFAIDTGVQATLTWTGTAGNPTLGAVEFDVTPRPSDGGSTSGAWIEYDTALGNLTGRTVAAWVRLVDGTSPQFKVYAQSGSQYIWEDNGTVTLAPQTWTCVSLPVSSPSFNQADYDPTDVIRIGFEMLATSPFRLDLDTVVVY